MAVDLAASLLDHLFECERSLPFEEAIFDGAPHARVHLEGDVWHVRPVVVHVPQPEFEHLVDWDFVVLVVLQVDGRSLQLAGASRHLVSARPAHHQDKLLRNAFAGVALEIRVHHTHGEEGGEDARFRIARHHHLISRTRRPRKRRPSRRGDAERASSRGGGLPPAEAPCDQPRENFADGGRGRFRRCDASQRILGFRAFQSAVAVLDLPLV
mmetsp:Transcript_49824/g.117826  ORF Transcript_49824/g.117826 Transcript_49824/m.117826 type:complete len:212 (-) Transcript_49824:229-864(-)